MSRTSRPLSEEAVDVGSTADPVAAVLDAHRQGKLIALRTSGSSGPARAVVRTTSSWFESFPAVAALTGLSPTSQMWIPGPLSSTMNLFAAVLARHLGARLVERVEEASHAHLTPLALAGLLDRAPATPGLHVTVAGDRLSSGRHDRAVAAGLSVAHYYGAAELSFVAWGSHGDAMRPFPRVEVDVRRGELWVRSPFLCRGYAGLPGALRRDADGFATVGDRGAVRDGFVEVAGRDDSAVTTGGATVLVADVERHLQQHLRGEVVVLGVPHHTLGQVLTAVLTERDDLVAARETARSRLEPASRPRLWFHVSDLPVTGTGKLDRLRLREVVAGPGAVRLPGSR